MQIYIQHQGQQTGPFPPEVIQAGLRNGTYQPTDLAWHEGAAGWVPLASLPGFAAGTPPHLPGLAGLAPKTNGLAISSLVLGILAFLSAGLTGIPAVICGHLGLSRIKKSGGRETGGGLAIAGLICGYFGIAILGVAFLAGLTAPLIIRQRKKADQTEAVSNARQVGIALSEFESTYGEYPNDATAAAVAKSLESKAITGQSANARFRQLIQSGILLNEAVFHARAKGLHRPDGNITGDRAVDRGECGFAYISGVFPKDAPPRPIAIAPVIPGTNQLDQNAFDRKAVVLWTDGSVRSLPINRATGKVELDGQNLLDPANPVWNGVAPQFLPPE